MPILLQFAIGLMFGIGFIVSGMSDPAKVLNFLDLGAIPAGTWDPSLAFVLVGGVAVASVGYRRVLGQPRPLYDDSFHLPTATEIDARVVAGPAVFGIGWGLVGLCPGPAFTAVGFGTGASLKFVAAMLAGMWAARALAGSRG